MFEALKYVTGGLTLAAFIVAVIAVIVRAAIRRKEQLILTAPEAERAKLVELALESFHIDTTPLTKKDKYDLLIRQMASRERRLKIWQRFWIRVGVGTGIVTIILVALLAFPFTAQLLTRFESIQPRLSRPYDGVIFDTFPRNVTLEWEPVSKAKTYEVEVQWQNPEDKIWHTLPNYPHSVNAPAYSFAFVGAQPGRWRILAISNKGVRTSWSDWRYFSFTK